MLEVKIFVCSMVLWNDVHRRSCGELRFRLVSDNILQSELFGTLPSSLLYI
jgi:hypothetical protein